MIWTTGRDGHRFPGTLLHERSNLSYVKIASIASKVSLARAVAPYRARLPAIPGLGRR